MSFNVSTCKCSDEEKPSNLLNSVQLVFFCCLNSHACSLPLKPHLLNSVSFCLHLYAELRVQSSLLSSTGNQYNHALGNADIYTIYLHMQWERQIIMLPKFSTRNFQYPNNDPLLIQSQASSSRQSFYRTHGSSSITLK